MTTTLYDHTHRPASPGAMSSAKEAVQRQRRQQKLLVRVKFQDAWQQEVAIKGLLEEGNIDVLFQLLATGSGSGDGSSSSSSASRLDPYGSGHTLGDDDADDDDAEIGRGASSSSSSGAAVAAVTLPTLAVATSVCHGLDRLVGHGKVEVGPVVKRMLAVLEETLLCASFLPQQHQQQQVQNLLALYVNTLTQVMLDAVAQECGCGNSDAALLWCEQAPLVLALGFNQARMTPLVLSKASFFETRHVPAHPEVTLVALQAPLLVAGLLEAQSPESKVALVEALGSMPLDYLPQTALVALATCYLELLSFLPWPALTFPTRSKERSPVLSGIEGSGGGRLGGSSAATDAQLVGQLSKVVFHLVCHLEAPGDVHIVGCRLAHHLVKHVLAVVVQGSTAVLPMSLLLPLLVMLERLAEHDATLLAPDFPLLSYILVAMGKAGVCGRERIALLATLQAILKSHNDQDCEGVSSSLTSHALRWSLYPLLSLTSVSDAAASLVALVEQRLRTAPPSVLSSGSGPGRGLRTLLAQAPSDFFRRSVASLVNSLEGAPRNDLATIWQREWALFLVMGMLFNEDAAGDSDGVTISEEAQGLLESLVAQDKKGFLGARLFPAVLYRLDRCGKAVLSSAGPALATTTMAMARLQSRLLWLLPALGSHGVGAQLVQAFLQRIASAPALVEASKAARTPRGTSQLQGCVGLCTANLGTATLALSAALYRRNTRTFSQLRQLVLAAEADATSAAATSRALGDEVDEFRLARVLAISDVVREDPEVGSEFVGLLQTYLMDAQLPGVVATAVDCMTYLCSADCLDYLAAARILQKKGRVQFKEHPLVLANLADFFGAGAYIFDCTPRTVEGEEDGGEEIGGAGMEYGGDEDEERRPRLLERHLVNLTDYLWLLAQQPSASVRRQAYLALAGYVPALLASEEEQVPLDLHRRIFQALQEDGDAGARGGLMDLLKEAFLVEAEDSGTWRRTLLGTGGTSGADASQAAAAAAAAAKPSHKTLKALPTADEVLSLYQKYQRDVPGLAGATLHALGRKRRWSPSPSTTMGRSKMLEVFVDALNDEDGGGRCVVQRLLVPHSFLRFLPALIQERVAGRPASLAGTLEAVEEVEAAIQSVMEQHRQQGCDANNCFLALAALANALPPQLSHKTAEVVATLRAAVMSDAATGIALDIPTLLVSLGLAGRCLGPADAECVVALVREVFVEHTQAAFAARTDWGWCQWGALVGAGVLTDWVRQVYSPDAITLELLAIVTRSCLGTLQDQALHSEVLASMLQGPRGSFSLVGMVQQRGGANGVGGTSSAGPSTVPWAAIDLGEAASSSSSSSSPLATNDSSNNQKLAVVGASWALAIVAPNLAHVGLEQTLLQLYHVLRAAARGGVPAVHFPLGVVAALALKADLLDSSEIFALLQEMVALVGDSMSGGKTGEDADKSDDDGSALLLGVAHLAVSIQGVVTLPAGLMDGLKRRLAGLVRTLSSTGTGAASGEPQQQVRTLAACLSMYTVLASGGPLLDIMGKDVGAGLSAERSTAGMTTDLVEALRRGVVQSLSQRQRSAAARVLGLLVALKEEEEEEEDEVETGEDGGSGRAPGARAGGGGRGSGGHRLDANTFGLPSEGTLLRLVLAELLRLAVGEGDADPAGSSGFVVATLGALTSCRVLKFQHKQMTLVLQNFVKLSQARLKQQQQQQQQRSEVADKDAENWNDALAVIRACVAFAVTMARRDAAYITWLYDVAVNAPPAVVNVVLDVLDDLVRLTPTALQAQLLGVLWRKCFEQEQEGTAALARATKLLTGLALGCEGNDAGSGTGESAWAFVATEVLGFLLRFSSRYLQDTDGSGHASRRVDGAGSSLSLPFQFLDALARVLAALARIHPKPDRIKEHLEQTLIPTRLSGSASEVGGIMLTILLVEQGTVPVAQLNTLRLQLVGPRSASQKSLPAAFCHSLIPWVVRPLWVARGKAMAAAQREWILALLDYLTVDPTNSRPLVVLVFLFTGALSWLGMAGGGTQDEALPLLQTQLRGALARAERVELCTAESTAEDRWRTEVLREGATVLFAESEDAAIVTEWGVQVVSRAVKILQSLSSGARRESELVAQLLQRRRNFDGEDASSPYLDAYKLLVTGVVAGATQGAGVGLLRRLPPASKRFVAEWSVVMSMMD